MPEDFIKYSTSNIDGGVKIDDDEDETRELKTGDVKESGEQEPRPGEDSGTGK